MKRRVAATWPMTIFTSIIFISKNHIIKQISKIDSKNIYYYYYFIIQDRTY